MLPPGKPDEMKKPEKDEDIKVTVFYDSERGRWCLDCGAQAYAEHIVELLRYALNRLKEKA